MNPLRVLPAVAAAALLWAALLWAASAEGEEGKCVAPVDVMRRYHMDLLFHQRDDTVRRGIRDGRYSLKGCVSCHAVPDPAAGGEPTVRPFCETCHAYVAVRIDCFQCHTAKPGRPGR